jgi:hypothetical protein
MKRNILFTFIFLVFGTMTAFAQNQDQAAMPTDTVAPKPFPLDILNSKGMPTNDVAPVTELPSNEVPIPPGVENTVVPVVTPPTPKQEFIEDEEEKVGATNSNGKARKKDTSTKGKKAKKKKGNTEDTSQEDNRRRK